MEMLSYEEAKQMTDAEIAAWFATYREWRDRQYRRAELQGALWALASVPVAVAIVWGVFAVNGWI